MPDFIPIKIGTNTCFSSLLHTAITTSFLFFPRSTLFSNFKSLLFLWFQKQTLMLLVFQSFLLNFERKYKVFRRTDVSRNVGKPQTT
jgi:hypothetical protein